VGVKSSWGVFFWGLFGGFFGVFWGGFWERCVKPFWVLFLGGLGGVIWGLGFWGVFGRGVFGGGVFFFLWCGGLGLRGGLGGGAVFCVRVRVFGFFWGFFGGYWGVVGVF